MDESQKQSLFENMKIEGLTEEELERLAVGMRNTSHGPPCCSCSNCSVGTDLRKWLEVENATPNEARDQGIGDGESTSHLVTDQE
jgi:hypothetical protein